MEWLLFLFAQKNTMPAANTDKFIKVTSNTGWQLDASGISDASVTSFGLISATSLPTDTAVILTVDRVNSSGEATPSKMERIIGVMSGTTVTSCVRGLEGTAQSHSAGAVVEIVISKSNINKLMEGILAEHNQDGTHGDVSSTSITTTGAITGTQISTPTNPASGKNKLYFKAGDKLYKLTSSGVESEVVSTKAISTIVSSATPAINVDTTDFFTITALATAITSFTTNLTGTPSTTSKQTLTIRIKDDGTARAITWGASFASRGATLPTTTVLGKYLYVGFIYNSTASVWDCVALSQEV